MPFKTDVVIEFVFGDIPPAEGFDRVAPLGFDGIEILQWEDTPLEEIAAKRDETGLEIVNISGYGSANVSVGDAPSLTHPDHFDTVVEDLERSISAAEALDCENIIITVGRDREEFTRREQRENMIDALSAVADTAERAGVVLGVEPLNRVEREGYFLNTSKEGYEIVEAVDSPGVQLLFDIYHQQHTEGNIIQNLERYMDRISHIHVANCPGRRPLGIGELNFDHILQWLDASEYDGYVGIEFSGGEDPEAELRASKQFVPHTR